MLRVRPCMETSKRYVCGLCRRKLVPATLTPVRCRPSLHRLTDSSVPRFPAGTHLPGRVRGLVTTRALRNTDDNGSSSSGQFPGAFGVGGASTFGGFGAKKTGTVDGSTGGDSLLPHEREARDRMAAKAAQRSEATRSSANEQRGNDRANRTRRSADFQDKADKSRSALADIFQKSQQNRRPRSTHDASQTGNATTRPDPPTEPSKSFEAARSEPKSNDLPTWGAFSKRRTTTVEPMTSFGKDQGATKDQKQGQQKAKTRNSSWPSQEKTSSSGSSSSGIWGELQRSRHVSSPGGKAKAKTPPPAEQDFWGELEGRVDEFAKRRQEFRAETMVAPTMMPEMPATRNDNSNNVATEEPRRRSRFDMDDDRYGGGKSKKPERKKSQRAEWRERKWDDDNGIDWDEMQRRKEAKRLRKLQEEEEAGPVPIFLPEFINVSSLARSLKQKANSFLRDLEEMGFENMTSDTIMTGETAALIAMEYGFDPTVDDGAKRDLRPRPAPEDTSSLPQRPPIVTIMGHVDHGKTTLLDWLRKSSVVAQEHGGITQHIGAFVVKMSTGSAITFLDTPGHAAFLTMRQRGANVTDIVVLVVAADDSVMPQTLEALRHANNSKVPIIVAINKVDKEDARVDQVKADLSRHGVEIEDYGGDVQVVCVSGKTGLGMEELEENIVTLSEILDTRAETDGMAEGWVLESSVKTIGKVATVLVKRGTLRTGDVIVAGKSWARVRLLRNEAGVEIAEAPPGTPVEILGWRDLPEAGEQVLQAPDEDTAKTAVEYRQEMADRQEGSAYIVEQEQRQREREAAAAAAAEAKLRDAEPVEDDTPKMITQNFVVKADVAGSVEAVCTSVLEQGSNEVQSRILRSGTGQISEYDVDHAATSGSILVNFNMAVLPHIKMRAIEAGVRIIDHSVIYHLVDEARQVLSALLPKIYTHRVIGEADVLQIFPINIKGKKMRNIAGCKVRNGSIKKTSFVKVLRRGKVIYDGKIHTLKHVKKDVMEMGKGTECGIMFDGFEDLEVDDQVQTYDVVEEKRQL